MFTLKKSYCCLIALELMNLNFFIVGNDGNIIDRLLYNFKKCKIKDQKLSLCSLQFSVEDWEKLEQSKKEKLTNTAQNFFHLLTEFAKLKKQTK